MTIVFGIEFVAKIIAHGLHSYIRDGFNMFDAIILVISIIELLEEARSGLSVLRTFRLIRFLRLLRFFPTMQRQLATMLRTLDNIATFLLLLTLFFLLFSIIGMSLFGCRYLSVVDKTVCKISNFQNGTSTEDETCQRWEAFESPLSALLTVLQILTQDDGWSQVMRDAMASVGPWASVYFVLLVVFGSYVLLSMLLAIIEVGLTRNFGKQKSFHDSVSPCSGNFIYSRTGTMSREPNRHPTGSAIQDTSDMVTSSTQPSGPPPGLFDRFLQWLGSDRFSKEGDYSLFLLAPDNRARKWLLGILTSKRFDQIVLVVILFNCLVVAFERPAIAPDSFERRFLDEANHFFNTFFIIEAALKIIAEGFVYGSKTYLRNGWNIFDFCLVSLSIVELLIELNEARFATAAIKALHILRLFHTFRPLRAINRAPGLKMVLKTLATTLKPIGVILIITLCIFFVFGVLGVQLYRGCFFRCRIIGEKQAQMVAKRRMLWAPHRLGQHHHTVTASSRLVVNESLISVLPTITNRDECLVHEGLEWSNEENNFDSLGHALMTLFVLLSFDGWKDIAQNGLNCVGVDLQPQRNYNPWHLIFFMSFLMINGFCLIDMFAGVVVNNYAKVKDALERETYAKLDALQAGGNEAVSTMFARRRGGLAPRLDEMRLQYWEQFPKWRLKIHQLCTHRYFEATIEATVAINILAMAVEHYEMSGELQYVLRIINIIVLLAFIFEAVVRLIAFGLKRYLRNRWHLLDIAIIIASLIGIVLESMDNKLIPLNPSVVRTARICRITRIFRLFKMALGIQGLFQTVLNALPQVGNLSLLLMLAFFIYGSLGVEMFGKLEGKHRRNGLSKHANFHNVGMSILALFRIATGDHWHELLNDVLEQATKANCSGEDADRTVCSLISLATQFYFVSFILLVQFVLINIVVTVLMRQLEESDRKEIFEKARARMAKHDDPRTSVGTFCHQLANRLTTTESYRSRHHDSLLNPHLDSLSENPSQNQTRIMSDPNLNQQCEEDPLESEIPQTIAPRRSSSLPSMLPPNDSKRLQTIVNSEGSGDDYTTCPSSSRFSTSNKQNSIENEDDENDNNSEIPKENDQVV